MQNKFIYVKSPVIQVIFYLILSISFQSKSVSVRPTIP